MKIFIRNRTMNDCCRCFPDDQEFHLCALCEQILQNRITVVLDEEFPQDQGYDSDWLAEPLPKYFECALCFGAFREPVQIRKCHHIFCTGCLEHAAREKKMCPVDREIFTETFLDEATKRAVMSLNVACKKEGCTWQGELSDLLEHLKRNCLKIRFACLNEGCEEVLCRENLFTHINDECQFRLCTCEFCALSITFRQIKKHHSVDCQRIPTSCEFVCGRRFPRNEIPEHLLVCEKRPLKCVFADFGCPFLGEKSLMATHVKNSVSGHLKRTIAKLREFQTKHDDLNTKHDNLNAKHDDLTTKHDDLTTKHNDLNAKHDDLNAKHDDLTTKHDDLTTKHDDLTTKHDDLNTKHDDLNAKHDEYNNEYKKEHAELKLKYEELQERCYYLQSVLLNKDNKFVWKISNYETHFQNAQNENPMKICSPAFYTSHGYKFQLSALLNGYGIVKNKHTGVFFNLCKGVNDDSLEWPFNKKYTLTIVSQNNKVVDKTRTFVPAEQGEFAKKCYTKPTTGTNMGRVTVDFLPDTKKQHYIKDDTMVIKCVIE